MATFILIPGGWQGGWAFEKVASILTARGHKALPITLSGLGDVPAPTANLDAHIKEAISAVKAHGDDLVVAGHSYGGMVVSGAADAEPTRIRAVVYIDAYVPESGDSVWSLTTSRFRDVFVAGAKDAGRIRWERFFSRSASADAGARCSKKSSLAHMDGKEVRSLISINA